MGGVIFSCIRVFALTVNKYAIFSAIINLPKANVLRPHECLLAADFGISKTNSIANYHHTVLGSGNVSIRMGAPISGVTKGMPSAAASLRTCCMGAVQACMDNLNAPQCMGIIALAFKSSPACALSFGNI